ncbi:ribonuclease P [Actinotalea ferrariae CF5-4]|uniref:Ribonuclease P protein component n=1 Tax=Actinotalea ferrariae CF5-4 TaxID=948458 RepID=A0A021VWS9_9CELL|nr:ribonuclease P protein component [Actinotalea ferrariae]EYR63527.1 ribonuclease P [Actinotalea ferrariae CF5-4]
MLPAALRMRRSEEYARTIRTGARAGRGTLVVHCAVDSPHPEPHIGFVVSKGVGGAVVRNRVRRRLRGAVIAQQDQIPAGTDVVVRALPPSASATYADLSDDLRSALGSALRRAGRKATTGGRP